MVVIENDQTMLVRLSAEEIEALCLLIDAQPLTEIQEILLRDIRFDLGRFEQLNLGSPSMRGGS